MTAKQVFPVMRMAEVCVVTRLSEATIRRLQDPAAPQYDPTFPKAFPLALRAKGFDGAAVLAWVAARNDSVREGLR